MARTLLNIIKAVTSEVGFPQPAEVLASQVQTVQQLKQLVIAACDELLDEFDWQRVLRLHTITTSAGVTLYPLPTDYHRIVSDTAWSAMNTMPAYGNMGAPVWEEQRVRNFSASQTRFRLIGNQVEVYPAPGAGETITFAYISKNYVIDGTNGLPKAEFSLDSDTTVFHDRLLTNFVKLKLLQVKNLDSRAVAQDFNASLESAKGNDVPAPTLSLDPMGVTAARLEEHELYDLMVRT